MNMEGTPLVGLRPALETQIEEEEEEDEEKPYPGETTSAIEALVLPRRDSMQSAKDPLWQESLLLRAEGIVSRKPCSVSYFIFLANFINVYH